VHAARHGGAAFIVGTSVFSAAIFLLYGSSTLYHALPAGKAKRVFRVVDHSLIYLLIAGTYTPFTLGVLGGPWGWTLFGVIWGLASIGVALKASGNASNPIFSTTLYLLMGWVVVIALLIARVPTPGLLWLLAGGCLTPPAYSSSPLVRSYDMGISFGIALFWPAPYVTTSQCFGMQPNRALQADGRTTIR
jgi:hemolysin III